jgi:hypothetical protein
LLRKSASVDLVPTVRHKFIKNARGRSLTLRGDVYAGSMPGLCRRRLPRYVYRN